VQRDAAEGLGDVDAHRATAMVCGSSPSERAWRASSSGLPHPPQLQAVHLARVGKVARVMDHDVAGAAARCSTKNRLRANAHGGDDVRQRLGELVGRTARPCVSRTMARPLCHRSVRSARRRVEQLAHAVDHWRGTSRRPDRSGRRALRRRTHQEAHPDRPPGSRPASVPVVVDPRAAEQPVVLGDQLVLGFDPLLSQQARSEEIGDVFMAGRS